MKNVQELGRSMIEMLGVLAIVGILSVGGLAGYQSAMWRYKTNKLTEQLSALVSALIQFDSKIDKKKITEYTYLTSILINAGEVPAEMVSPVSKIYLVDEFGNKIYVYYTPHLKYLGFNSRIEKNKIGLDICRSYLKIAQAYSDTIHSAVVDYKDEGDSAAVNDNMYGDRQCYGNRRCLKNMNIADIDDQCRVCDNFDSCNVFLIINRET